MNCLITITVTLTEELSTNCVNSNWVNETCNDLNGVLSHTVVPDYVDCIEIRLMPGTYNMITEVHQIRTNVVIHGASGVIVTFNL